MDDSLDAVGELKSGSNLHSYEKILKHQITEEDFYSESYKMDHKRRGIAVIFNNKNFRPETKMPTRSGTETDGDHMYKLLCALGFEDIRQHDDATVKEMQKEMDEVRKTDFKEKDCFLCVILTHGEEKGYVWGVDDKITVEDLVRPIKGNTSLGLKPKIFIIQACRGKNLDSGVEVPDAVTDPEAYNDMVEMRRIPTEADFLMAYSVVPGFFAWRNSIKGSWFIQAIFDVFMQKCGDGKFLWQKLDLLSLFTRVNKKVAYDFESMSKTNESINCKKQIPCITSMLTKDVRFR